MPNSEEIRLSGEFFRHLQADRGASEYTLRNYRQAVTEFARWFLSDRNELPDWPKLER